MFVAPEGRRARVPVGAAPPDPPPDGGGASGAALKAFTDTERAVRISVAAPEMPSERLHCLRDAVTMKI